MDPGVRTSPSLCLGPAPTRQSLPSAPIHCWRRQADHPARTHPPAAQDDTRIEEHTTGASTLPACSDAAHATVGLAVPNRCQQPDMGEEERVDRQPTRVRFAVRESELMIASHGTQTALPHLLSDHQLALAAGVDTVRTSSTQLSRPALRAATTRRDRRTGLPLHTKESQSSHKRNGWTHLGMLESPKPGRQPALALISSPFASASTRRLLPFP